MARINPALGKSDFSAFCEAMPLEQIRFVRSL